MRTLALVLAACLVACGRVNENSPADVAPIDGAPDTVVLETSPPDTQVGDGVDADAEFCPDPDYPPRTDGCPCRAGDPRYCSATFHTEGKVCVYKPYCAGGTSAQRLECRYIIKFEDNHWGWVDCSASCTTGECLPGTPDGSTDG